MSRNKRGVVLIGPRGAGKTTVGALLAAHLKLPFVDSDAVIEERTGTTIRKLMEQGVFRVREAQVLASLFAGATAVLACGGGSVVWDGFDTAARDWVVVWLDADPKLLAQRIAGSERPSLTGRLPEDEIADVAWARRHRYEALSWRRIPTDADPSETVARRIHELLKNEAKARFGSAD